MAEKYEYVCEQRPGYDKALTDHMNGMAADDWELVSAQFDESRPPHAWMIWRRPTAS